MRACVPVYCLEGGFDGVESGEGGDGMREGVSVRVRLLVCVWEGGSCGPYFQQGEQEGARGATVRSDTVKLETAVSGRSAISQCDTV